MSRRIEWSPTSAISIEVSLTSDKSLLGSIEATNISLAQQVLDRVLGTDYDYEITEYRDHQKERSMSFVATPRIIENCVDDLDEPPFPDPESLDAVDEDDKRFIEYELLRCPVCFGDGVMEITEFDYDACPECEGTGWDIRRDFHLTV